jgi:hypothetical protein
MNAIELRQKNRSLLVASQVHRRFLQVRAVGLGSTKATFYVPSGMTPTSASTRLTDAVQALLTAYNASGVPSEHAASPEALAVQEAWDADPIVIAAGSSALLDKDSGYGPNTHDAVAAVNGGSAPDVNTGPASTTTSTTVTSTTTTTTTAASDWTRPLLIGAAVVAAAGVTTAAVIHMNKKRAARRRQSATTRYPMPHGHRPAYT